MGFLNLFRQYRDSPRYARPTPPNVPDWYEMRARWGKCSNWAPDPRAVASSSMFLACGKAAGHDGDCYDDWSKMPVHG